MTAPLGTNIVVDTNIKTTLTDSVNVCLSVVGEAPVAPSVINAAYDTGTNLVKETAPTQVRIALDTIEEVNREVQSRNYWFAPASGSNFKVLNSFLNPAATSDATNDGNGWDTRIPQEARRYITIRAARVMQSRFIGNEELHKFSKDEELAAFAVLEQAHINNTTGLDFTSLPAEVNQLGISDYLFLQSTTEEKFAQIRMVTELKQQALLTQQALTDITQRSVLTNQALKLAEETDLLEQQALTEVQETLKRQAEVNLVADQEALVEKQVLTEVAQELKVDAETELLTAQELLTDAQKSKTDAEAALIADQEALVTQQKLTEVQETAKRQAEAALVADQEALVTQQKLTEVEETIRKTKEAELLDTQETLVTQQQLTEVQETAKRQAEAALVADQEALVTQQRLTEVQQTAKVQAEAALIADQEALVTQQKLTEVEETTRKTKEAELLDTQETLVSQQKLTEEKETAKRLAETALIADQEALVTQQRLTEIQETTKRTREHELIDAQEALIQKQILTEAEQVAKVQEEVDLLQSQQLKVDAEELLIDAQKSKTDAEAALIADQEAKTVAEKNLLESQRTQLDTQTALQLTEEKSYSDAITGISSGTTYQDFAAELRMIGVQEPNFYELPAYKKKEALKDAAKLRVSSATESGSDATEITIVNNIRRMIGESPISALNGDSLASEAVRLLRKTSTELQGRGWWFNTEVDVELTADGSGRIATAGMLTVELNDYDTRIKNVGGTKYLYDLKEKSHTSFSGTIKGRVIYQRDLNDIPQKFQEYLEIRVAILLTEMYPRDGVDIQRLPRIERELEAYFKDRENDEGNYNILDSYHASSRVGINRNYELV